jgi:hypothetical protein
LARHRCARSGAAGPLPICGLSLVESAFQAKEDLSAGCQTFGTRADGGRASITMTAPAGGPGKRGCSGFRPRGLPGGAQHGLLSGGLQRDSPASAPGAL